ncbi:MAG: DNA polymerase IV [Granulosicoccus sp.]|nr:DNA polymerase IV [Granulosicoccus sp.]
MSTTRKILHVDMDAFYASVEQRDEPALRGKPVVVGGSPYSRGVVAACSYEAREYGIRSAMPSRQAMSLCPHALFIPPRFQVYRSVSEQIQAIFREYTPQVEPLSLDEAYLDVTNSEHLGGSATNIALEIKARILSATGLVASAGVSYNKFLAKIASDMDKPDGFYRILPDEGEAFISRLPIGRFYGVGAVTEAKMQSLGIHTGADLRRWSQAELTEQFGKGGQYYFDISRGVDHREVSAERNRKSIGAETTFDTNLREQDAMLKELTPLADRILHSLEQQRLIATTATVKVRFADFRLVTRSHSQALPISRTRLQSLLPILLQRALEPDLEVRLLGVSLSGLQSPQQGSPQMELFDDDTECEPLRDSVEVPDSDGSARLD